MGLTRLRQGTLGTSYDGQDWAWNFGLKKLGILKFDEKWV